MVVTRPITAHLTNWLNMLRLRDKVNEYIFLCLLLCRYGCNRGTAHRQGQHAETQGQHIRANSSTVVTANECQLRHTSHTGSTYCVNMLRLRDKVKE